MSYIITLDVNKFNYYVRFDVQPSTKEILVRRFYYEGLQNNATSFKFEEMAINAMTELERIVKKNHFITKIT